MTDIEKEYQEIERLARLHTFPDLSDKSAGELEKIVALAHKSDRIPTHILGQLTGYYVEKRADQGVVDLRDFDLKPLALSGISGTEERPIEIRASHLPLKSLKNCHYVQGRAQSCDPGLLEGSTHCHIEIEERADSSLPSKNSKDCLVDFVGERYLDGKPVYKLETISEIIMPDGLFLSKLKAGEFVDHTKQILSCIQETYGPIEEIESFARVQKNMQICGLQNMKDMHEKKVVFAQYLGEGEKILVQISNMEPSKIKDLARKQGVNGSILLGAGAVASLADIALTGGMVTGGIMLGLSAGVLGDSGRRYLNAKSGQAMYVEISPTGMNYSSEQEAAYKNLHQELLDLDLA